MLRPSFREFQQLAKTATLVPVAKSISADLLTPVSAFLAFAGKEPYSFLLESVEGGEKVGRYTFLGARPYMRMKASAKQVEVFRGNKRQVHEGDPLPILRGILRSHRPAHIQGLPPFTAGAVGYFAYDTVRRFERLPSTAKDDLHLPDCEFLFFDRLLAFDHVRHQIHIIASADVREESPKAAYERALADIEVIEKKLRKGWNARSLGPENKNGKNVKIHYSTSRDGFMKSVEKAKEYIAAGDVFQVVLSQRLDFEPGAAPFDIYRALRTVNPSPYMYYLRLGDSVVLGSSPEMLVRVTDRKLDYRPIAGTRPRGKDDAEDQALGEDLLQDEKERAEHVMLVDLGRNDVGRVSDYGTVKVRDFMYVERYSHVMHLVSAIQGTLREDLDALDAFAACFPAGTLSGAPKVRAMEIIEELEPLRRGVYGGSVLYADFAGNLDSCIAIRTMLIKGKRAYLQAGAGIVADSVPSKEHEECLNKAKALVKAVDAARAMS